VSGTALGFLGILGALLIAIVTSLVTTEARGSIPKFCNRLLDRTAARLPEEMRDRREEWAHALYEAKDRPITQMAIAARMWLNGRSLAREAVEGAAEAEGPGRLRRSAGAFAALIGGRLVADRGRLDLDKFIESLVAVLGVVTVLLVFGITLMWVNGEAPGWLLLVGLAASGGGMLASLGLRK
jgi:hypothetical protein